MLARIEIERSSRHLIRFRFDGDQTGGEKCLSDDVVEQMSFQPMPAREEIARGAIGEDDATLMVRQHDRERRCLQHRLEQQFALQRFVSLLAKDVADLVVDRHQIADFVVAGDVKTEAEIAVCESAHAIDERAEISADATQGRADEREHQCNADDHHDDCEDDWLEREAKKQRRERGEKNDADRRAKRDCVREPLPRAHSRGRRSSMMRSRCILR